MQKEILKNELKNTIKHIRMEIVEIKNYYDDSEKFKNYLYYLHGLFSKLELAIIKLERLEKEEISNDVS